MCGISGIYRFSGNADGDDAVVRQMNAKLERRGPDDEGVLHQNSVTLGNRRLAILDLTPAGHQPMRSTSGHLAITFNGEIYNFREIAKELGLDSTDLHSQTDTEILLRAWERWGVDTLGRLVGQWAFAIHDRDTNQLWLCRDRFGEKPFYYYRDNATVTFASSIPSLMAAPWTSNEIDPDALAEYVAIRYVLAPRTIIKDVRKLPPGHLACISGSEMRIARWYRPRFRRDEHRASQDSHSLAEEFGELFTRASKRCLISDVPVALLLSNGIDSMSIHHALGTENGSIPSYTFKAVADGDAPSLGAPKNGGTTEVNVPTSHRLQQMEPAFASLTEPVGDGAALATWLLIRGAREKATVFLCGHGGDEVLGGYRIGYDRFRLEFLNALSFLPAPWMEGQAGKYFHGPETFHDRWHRLRWHQPSAAPAVSRYLINRPLPQKDLQQLYLTENLRGSYLDSIDELYEQSTGNSLDRMQEVMMHTFLSANILSWADGVAMDSSAELRMPFLDRDVVEFAFSLPQRMRAPFITGRTRTKMILRRWGQGRLDDAVLKRGKHGFPFGNLPAVLETDGEQLRQRILDAAPLRRMLPGLEQWVNHPPSYFREPWEGTLWAIISLAIWSDNAGVR